MAGKISKHQFWARMALFAAIAFVGCPTTPYAGMHGASDGETRAAQKLFVYRGSKVWAVRADGLESSNFACACFAVSEAGVPLCVLASEHRTEARESKACDPKRCGDLFAKNFFTDPNFCIAPSRVFYSPSPPRELNEAETQALARNAAAKATASAPAPAESAPSAPFVPYTPFPVLDPKKGPFPF